MNLRRVAIEKLCRMFLTRQIRIPEEFRNIYIPLLRSLVPNKDCLTITDVGGFIESIGDKVFNERPANMVYIMVFLEFVRQVSETVDNVSVDVFVASAVNVIEKTTFNPVPVRQVSFRSIISIFVNICASVVNFVCSHYI